MFYATVYHSYITCALELSVFNGLALHKSGLDSSRNTMTLCNHCLKELKSKRVPKLALANGLAFGNVPPELAALTWVEERLIALYRVSVMVLAFKNDEVPGARKSTLQPKFKGQTFCVSQDTMTVNKLLPIHPNQLKDDLQVRDILIALPHVFPCS